MSLKLSPNALKPGSRTSCSIKIKRVVLKGAPFKNPKTVQDLVRLSVPKLSDDEARDIVEKAQKDPCKEVTVIVCLEDDAERYCRNLVENGLLSEVT